MKGGATARLLVPLLAALVLSAVPGPGSAQDIEAVARARGVELPEGYWERIRQNPDFFELPNGLFRAPRAEPAFVRRPRPPVTGEARLPIILALFSDSDPSAIGPDDVERSLFTGPAPRGTMTEFYEEISGGRFSLKGEVFPWVRTSLTMAEVVGSSSGLGGDARVGEYLLEALELNDDAVDFSVYDNDGPDGLPNSGDDDGVVDAMVFEFAEVAASCGGPAIWPHRAGISFWNDGEPFVTDDMGADGKPIRVNGYIIQGVTDCSGESVQDAGTISHEFGHVLGLPDYYHPVDGLEPENRRWVLGCWALMAAGSWGCGPVGSSREAFGPTHMISWSKQWLGWLQYQEVGPVRNQEFVLDPVETTGQALRVRLAGNDEFLLIEYRGALSFDSQLPAAGILVVHQDFNGQVRPDSGLRYFLRMAEADGDDGLLKTTPRGGDRGVAGDAFGVGGTVGRMNDLTDPGTAPFRGGSSTVTIHSMTVEGGRARIRLSTTPDPAVLVPEEGVEVPLAGVFERRMRIAGGAMPYQVSVTGSHPEGLEVSADQDELILSGAVAAQDGFDVALQLLDALGSPATALVPVSVGEFFVADDRVTAHLLGGGAEPLNPAERTVLDRRGNGNGRFDVGDVRARLTSGG